MSTIDSTPGTYRTRFAPSPTGALHFGSLVAAVGSWLRARASGGQWLIRIEDIDPPRTIPGAAESQLRTLARFGLEPDDEVRYQSHFEERHEQAIATLLEKGLAYPCGCTRKNLPASGIYPGTCRNGLPPGRSARSIRLRTDLAEVAEFVDVVQGRTREHPGARTGDFVIRRGDGLVAYQLAVVVDDAAEGMTEVVRGADLLDSTARQIHVYRCLDLQPPGWMHLPLIVDGKGRKLSKSDADDPVERFAPTTAVRLALRALGHESPGRLVDVRDQLDWALQHWDTNRIPRGPIVAGVHQD